MNPPIIRLYGALLLLFAALVGFTSYWAVFDSQGLKDNPQNRRPLIEAQTVKRGEIKTADGVTVAQSVPEGGGNHPIYVRRYPQGSLFGNPVGYSFINVGQTGVEESENGVLSGQQNEFASILDQLRGTAQTGSSVTLTLDAGAQRVATQALENAIASTPGASGHGGAVVALDPSTGAVKVMASVPGYDPNAVKDTQTFQRLNKDASAPLLNRPTQSPYPPGSTMKVVTAAAAIDSGQFTPSSVLTANSPMTIGGVPLQNDANESYGPIDMTTALTNSVNTYFAQLGEKLGADTMFEYMDRFGFNRDPGLDYPSGEMAPSGVYDTSNGTLLGQNDPIDIGRVAIGQERLLVTPMQMAEVAATIANGGTLMRPTLVQEVTDPDGRVTSKLDPQVQARVLKPSTATEMTKMMLNVTQDPTATGAGLTVNGQAFPGKTGTAEINIPTRTNQPWFIAFAPASDPQIAVAATIERCTGCFGAQVAGPIATQVMEALVH